MASWGETLYASMLRQRMAQQSANVAQAQRQGEIQQERRDNDQDRMLKVIESLDKSKDRDFQRQIQLAQLSGQRAEAKGEKTPSYDSPRLQQYAKAGAGQIETKRQLSGEQSLLEMKKEEKKRKENEILAQFMTVEGQGRGAMKTEESIRELEEKIKLGQDPVSVAKARAGSAARSRVREKAKSPKNLIKEARRALDIFGQGIKSTEFRVPEESIMARSEIGAIEAWVNEKLARGERVDLEDLQERLDFVVKNTVQPGANAGVPGEESAAFKQLRLNVEKRRNKGGG